MIVGVVKEIKNNENRIGMTPACAAEYVAAGHSVLVEKNGGLSVGFLNDGDVATIIGRQDDNEITADEVAKLCGTISYEVVAPSGKERIEQA